MTETIKQLRERVLRLDAERTPGKWESGCHPANERLCIVKPIMFGKYVGKLPDCEGGAVYLLHKPNADLIALIPDMIKLIRAQQERENRLVAAITKTLEENAHLADGDVCTLSELKKALASISDEQEAG